MDNFENYMYLAGGWILYLALHSFMASISVKMFFKQNGLKGRSYRIFYNVIAITGLLVLLLYNSTFGHQRVLPNNEVLKIMALCLGGIGVLILHATFKQYSFKGFLGVKKEISDILSTKGILQYVRHPIYLATILMLMGFFLFDPRYPTMVSIICIYLYLPVGIWLEEKKLLDQFGDQYRRYKKDVPAIIPDIKRLLKKIT
ncbi:MAG: isoprenylcysteine carboxylmethyltransferase family protein [Fulvivirga sp.]|nr:isoprenylcysteine carboxylmethyltransferase family protein [Fulvivirga sp.]